MGEQFCPQPFYCITPMIHHEPCTYNYTVTLFNFDALVLVQMYPGLFVMPENLWNVNIYLERGTIPAAIKCCS